MPFVLCSDFSVFPDDTQLGPAFTLSAMDFKDMPGGRPSFVNLTKAELGLQFADQGLDVSLPTIVSWARFRVGQFNSPFTVEGLDVGGNVIGVFNMNVNNSYLNFVFKLPNLSAFRFRGGGDEGVLVSLCLLI